MTELTKEEIAVVASIKNSREEFSEALTGKDALITQTAQKALDSSVYTMALFSELSQIDTNDVICTQTADILTRNHKYAASIRSQIEARAGAIAASAAANVAQSEEDAAENAPA